MTLVKEKNNTNWVEGDPLPGYQFAYRLPVDFCHPRFLVGGGTFELGTINTETFLMTNTEGATLVYTKQLNEPARWETSLYSLIVATLALEIAPALGVDDSAYSRAMKNFQMKYQQSLTMQANMESPASAPNDWIPDWLAARGAIGYREPNPNFIYPLAGLSYGLT